MTMKKGKGLLLSVCAFAGLLLSFPLHAGAQTETLLFSFGNNSGGWMPATVTTDGSGNYYGTGGAGNGMVYQIYPSGSGWKEKMIHSFGDTADGASPTPSLIFDGQGNLYGSTYFGGKSPSCPASGCTGIVYELSPTTSGPWKLTVLHTFTGGAGGASPIGLVFDSAGNIFGMTQTGGNMSGVCASSSGCGTAFRLSPKSGGGWQFTSIHTFNGNDGLSPQGSLLVDASGNLYGSTAWGGNSKYCSTYGLNGCGTVFRLTPTGKGGYGISGLHHFSDLGDGANPGSLLVFDASGNLYGGTGQGGSSAPYGVIFELSPTASGPWTFNSIHNFTDSTSGKGIYGGLTIDAAGTIYGSSPYGGTQACDCGAVFKLAPGTNGWTFTLLHAFTGSNTDGFNPGGNLILDSSGNLFGITFLGGAYSGGTFYEITP
jgi:uncharacterized repeat protein (TIGR03803 family)